MLKSLVISTWGSKETPSSFGDIYVGTEDILVIFALAQSTKTDKLRASFF